VPFFGGEAALASNLLDYFQLVVVDLRPDGCCFSGDLSRRLESREARAPAVPVASVPGLLSVGLLKSADICFSGFFQTSNLSNQKFKE